MSDFIVSFVGLPSSGKSSVINSLVFRRLLQSGVCRTTTEFKLIDEDVFDDKNNKFRVYDLPGICDSEEKNNNNFNDLTYAHITNSNLIIWTSDVNKAFLTTHEVNEYNKLKKYIKDLSDTSGTLYHVIIMLSKCDKDLTKEGKEKKNTKNVNDEIDDSDEDTDIIDLIKKVKEKFIDEDILLYNAYGRSYHNKKTSDILKKFVKKSGEPSKFNISFDISKYIIHYSEEQRKLYYIKFLDMYNKFLNNEVCDIINYWNKISKDEQISHLLKICDDEFSSNYRIFQYINLVINKLYDNIKEYNELIYLRLIRYYKYIISNNGFYISQNYYCEYNLESITTLFIDIFKNCSFAIQLKIYTNLFIDHNLSNISCINIIKKIHSEGYTKEEFNFNSIFNSYIIDCKDPTNYNNFYEKALSILNNQPKSIIPDNISIHEQIIWYLNYLNFLSDDDDYILLNKLQIISNLYLYNNHNKLLGTREPFYTDSKFKDIYYQDRLEHNELYLKVVNKIWNKIYSNVQFSYTNKYFRNFVPLDKLELLYNEETINSSIYKDILDT